ncbi:MAG: pirin family protein [Allosphingosinicella sp.]|uniref:pirin family protein n=1 Tax=Allosphingosinicella sp. TaxID=2823234 RepID=UPI0039219494
MTTRQLLRSHAAYRDDIGDLVTRRPLPGPNLPQLDPFLFLNHHGPQRYLPNNSGLPFGPHPHRGFETVTFILEGSLAHSDTGGHESVIDAGGVQWMTAGSGLIHAELSPAAFKRDGGDMEILQLWLNLPARLKMTPPRYTGVQRPDIPAIAAAPGATVNLIAGSLDGITGPIDSLTDTFMSVIRLDPGAELALPAPTGRTVFLYLVRGEAKVAGSLVPQWHLAQLGDGDEVQLASREGATLLFGHSKPLGEPVVAHGPFVMNTPEEIVQAIQDYQAGLFGDPAALA